mgnify:CR=1 FL=1
MNDINVNVQNYDVVKTSTVNNIKITVMSMELFKNIVLRVALLADKTIVDNKILKVEGADYANWGNDDKYIVNYCLEKLGLKPM